MKKFFSLFLAVLMLLLSVSLYGCGKEDSDISDEPEEEVINAITLKFYIVTEDETTDDARISMQDAFNKVSAEKYSTQIEFVFCTAEEYRAVLDAKLEASKKNIENGTRKPSDVYSEYEVVTELDEFNLPELKYPDVQEDQVDIVLITDKAMLDEYTEKGYLLDLTSYLNGANDAIKEYINTGLLTNTQTEDGKWFAIPNNVVVGEYTYLLINRDLAGNYYLIESDFTRKNTSGVMEVNYEKCLDFVSSLANDDTLENVIPIYEKFDFSTTMFWSQDGEKSFPLATFYSPSSKFGDYVTVSNVYENQNYIDYLKFIKESEVNGYFATEHKEGTLYGLRVVTGDYASRFTYEKDHFVLILDNPRVTSSDGFDAMFAVPVYTASAERSMQIIEDLMTDSQLCNILLYGVEGADYEINPDEASVSKLNTSYSMDRRYTGNVFMSYPCTTDGMTANYWTYGMQQNREAKPSPLDGCSSEYLWKIVAQGITDDQIILGLKALLKEYTGVTMDTSTRSLFDSAFRDYRNEIKFTDYMAFFDKLTVGSATDKHAQLTAEIQELRAMIEEDADQAADLAGTCTSIVISYAKEFRTEEYKDEKLATTLEDARTSIEAKALALQEELAAKIQEIEDAAKVVSDETIAEILSKADKYQDLIAACTSADEIDLAVVEILEDMRTSAVFSNTRNGTWRDHATEPFGMLQSSYQDAPVKSALAGALLSWYRALYN